MQSSLTDFGAWPSPLQAERLFNQPGAPAFPSVHDGRLYWLESRAEEGGRIAMMRAPMGADPQLVTPQGYNIRSRVHEYGGNAICFVGDDLLFVNFDDQRIYRQSLTDESSVSTVTVPKLADGRGVRYADLTLHPAGRFLFAVVEIENEDREHDNAIAVIDLEGHTTNEYAVPSLIATGADFYAAPTVNHDGSRLAFIEWQHPDMPWDATQLQVADIVIDTQGCQLANTKTVAGGAGRAVCQPAFGPDDALWFAMDIDGYDDGDPANFWNLYRFDGKVERVTHDLSEYGAAHWVFGWRRYLFLDATRLLAVRTGANGDELVTVDAGSGKATLVDTSLSEFAQLRTLNTEADRAAFSADAVLVAAGVDELPHVVGLDAKAHRLHPVRTAPRLLDGADISRARPLRVPCGDGEEAHAYYYPPRNAVVSAPTDSRPPVIVLVHGGPTSRAGTGFDLGKQFWTTRGFGVLDVNHRGSTGYGRRYRQRLRGEWGLIDADDVLAAVDYVIAHGWVDGDRIAIRGGSAGGYVVLNVLTRFPGRFRVGACYYGIGNLTTLANSTHKFERYYVDSLIGEPFDATRALQPSSRYHQRSPLHRVDQIRSATLLLQGGRDKVVPPEVSRECVAALESHGVEHDYVEYPEEGHGFRDPAVRVDALRRELAFVRKALGIGDSPTAEPVDQ